VALDGGDGQAEPGEVLNRAGVRVVPHSAGIRADVHGQAPPAPLEDRGGAQPGHLIQHLSDCLGSTSMPRAPSIRTSFLRLATRDGRPGVAARAQLVAGEDGVAEVVADDRLDHVGEGNQVPG
jgi:hypothetical protein